MLWKTMGSTVMAVALSVGVSPLCAKDLSSEAVRKLNENRVGIVAGQPGLTYIKIANDLAKELDDPESFEMRVMVIVGKGSEQNIDDLLHLRNVDIAIVQADVLDVVKQEQRYREIERKVGYITKLYEEDIHILARGDIETIEDLEGRRINIGGAGSGTAMTANRILDFLLIDGDLRQESSEAALSMLVADKLDAMFVVTGKGADFFSKIGEAHIREAGLHFLALPESDDLLDRFYPTSTLTAEHYPLLIGLESPVVTRSVPAVMAAINWKRRVDRRLAVRRFIDRFFGQFEGFAKPGYNENWAQVDLEADVLGWERLPDAADWLLKNPDKVRRIAHKVPPPKPACGQEDWLDALANAGVEVSDLDPKLVDQAEERFRKRC